MQPGGLSGGEGLKGTGMRQPQTPDGGNLGQRTAIFHWDVAREPSLPCTHLFSIIHVCQIPSKCLPRADRFPVAPAWLISRAHPSISFGPPKATTQDERDSSFVFFFCGESLHAYLYLCVCVYVCVCSEAAACLPLSRRNHAAAYWEKRRWHDGEKKQREKKKKLRW